MTGGINHDIITFLRQHNDGIGHRFAVRGALVGICDIEGPIKADMIWNAEVATNPLGPGAPVLDIMGETALP